MEEIWKDVVGYEGKYQVSNLGKIKSFNFKKGKILKPTGKTYLNINLYKNNISKKYYTHKLVLQTFIPNPENKPQVNHIDGNKKNNCINNLEWVTQSENIRHRFDVLGYKTIYQIKHPYKGKFGKNNPGSKKVNQYDLQGNFIKTWDCIIDIKQQLYITNISSACKGRYKTAGGFIWKYFIT